MGNYEPSVDVLAHHGILGQKWGVRRYQNKDGTLTEAGKRRAERQERREQKKTEKAERRAKEAERKKPIYELTDEELEHRLYRAAMEQRLAHLTPNEQPKNGSQILGVVAAEAWDLVKPTLKNEVVPSLYKAAAGKIYEKASGKNPFKIEKEFKSAKVESEYWRNKASIAENKALAGQNNSFWINKNSKKKPIDVDELDYWNDDEFDTLIKALKKRGKVD